MTLENIVYACYEEHKKHTSNWQHGKPQKAYYDLEGLKIFYEDGKIWHYRPVNATQSGRCPNTLQGTYPLTHIPPALKGAQG